MGDWLEDKTRRVEPNIGLTERSDDAVAAAFRGSKMDEEDLVVLMVDKRAEFGAHAGEVGGSELALEDGVLEMVAPSAHGFKDEAEALVVGDVVADEIGLAHPQNPKGPTSNLRPSPLLPDLKSHESPDDAKCIFRLRTFQGADTIYGTKGHLRETLIRAEFDDFFQAGTTYVPFDYQRRLADADAQGISKSLLITVPTGMGKTAAVVMAWLWNRMKRLSCPRRLVYCLPMRTLVEQTRDSVAGWLRNLARSFPNSEFEWLAEHSPVILMGGDEDLTRDEWDIWPEKPAILIGTQDMLLSRALNRGYGVSRARWPMHFGLLNNDCLWVADEVQLMGPGLWCTGQLDWMRQERFTPTLPSWTWWMSATNSDGFLETPDRDGLRPETFPFDASEMPAALRDACRPCELWTAPKVRPSRGVKAKSSALIGNGSDFKGSLASAINSGHQLGTLSLVVCNTVGTAQQLFESLKWLDCKGAELLLLTSRFRKVDRAVNERRLVDFERLRKAGLNAGSPGLICVATQVVEAGIDVSAVDFGAK